MADQRSLNVTYRSTFICRYSLHAGVMDPVQLLSALQSKHCWVTIYGTEKLIIAVFFVYLFTAWI